MNFNLDKPDTKKTLKRIKDLEIPSHEMDNLNNIIEGCVKFNYLHKAFLHYCLALKTCLDMEKQPQKTVDPSKWSGAVKIVIEGDE